MKLARALLFGLQAAGLTLATAWGPAVIGPRGAPWRDAEVARTIALADTTLHLPMELAWAEADIRSVPGLTLVSASAVPWLSSSGAGSQFKWLAAGWPWPCFISRSLEGATSASRGTDFRHGLRLFGTSVVPYRPILSGLIANFAFYLATVVVFRRVFGAAVRAHRRRSSRCVGCGHPAAENQTICPECGRATAEPANASTG